MRLSYAIDMRYGVLHDVRPKVLKGEPIDLAMGYVNVIWQGDANEQALRLLAHCTAPASPLNVTGPEKVGVRGSPPSSASGSASVRRRGREAPTAWLIDTTRRDELFGAPRVPLAHMIDWLADWGRARVPSLGKPTHFDTRDGTY